MNEDATELTASVAYRTLAWRHRHHRVGVFAIVSEIGDERARAWAECQQCAEVFEFVRDDVWRLAEGAEEAQADGRGGADAVVETAHGL